MMRLLEELAMQRVGLKRSYGIWVGRWMAGWVLPGHVRAGSVRTCYPNGQVVQGKMVCCAIWLGWPARLGLAPPSESPNKVRSNESKRDQLRSRVHKLDVSTCGLSYQTPGPLILDRPRGLSYQTPGPLIPDPGASHTRPRNLSYQTPGPLIQDLNKSLISFV